MAYTAVCNGPKTLEFAARFVSTWNQFPPEQETDVLVICNGGPLSSEQGLLFASLSAKFFPRSNEGYDVGGYIECSKGILAGYDMVLFCGESVYFNRSGWLKRLVESWSRYGPSMLGPFATHVIRAHLMTTAFACSPTMVAQYPLRVVSRQERMEFEHGERSLWRRLHKRGVPVKLVTWDGDWSPGQWRLPQNCIWRGNQSNLLMHCNHVDKFREADEKTKRTWTAWADRAYQ